MQTIHHYHTLLTVVVRVCRVLRKSHHRFLGFEKIRPWCLGGTCHMIVFSAHVNMSSLVTNVVKIKSVSDLLSFRVSDCLVNLLLSTSSQWHLYEWSHNHKWLQCHWIKFQACLLDTSRQRGNTFSPHNSSEAAEKLYLTLSGCFATSDSFTLGIGNTVDFKWPFLML